MTARLVPAAAAAALLAGCATTPPGYTETARFTYDPARCVDSIAAAPTHAIHRAVEDERPRDAAKPMQFGDLAACVRAADGLPFPALVFELDGRVPTQLDVSFLIERNIAFAARVELLTADYQPVRTVPFDAFVRRGYSYTGSVFLNADDANVRRLVLVPDTAAVGREEKSTVGVSNQNMVAVPVPAGIVYFNVSTGSEVTTRSWLSEVGSFVIVARDYQPPAAVKPR